MDSPADEETEGDKGQTWGLSPQPNSRAHTLHSSPGMQDLGVKTRELGGSELCQLINLPRPGCSTRVWGALRAAGTVNKPSSSFGLRVGVNTVL